MTPDALFSLLQQAGLTIAFFGGVIVAIVTVAGFIVFPPAGGYADQRPRAAPCSPSWRPSR